MSGGSVPEGPGLCRFLGHVFDEDKRSSEEGLLLVQEENKEWSPEKLKMARKVEDGQNCPGTFGVSFAIITGT